MTDPESLRLKLVRQRMMPLPRPAPVRCIHSSRLQPHACQYDERLAWKYSKFSIRSWLMSDAIRQRQASSPCRYCTNSQRSGNRWRRPITGKLSLCCSCLDRMRRVWIRHHSRTQCTATGTTHGSMATVTEARAIRQICLFSLSVRSSSMRTRTRIDIIFAPSNR